MGYSLGIDLGTTYSAAAVCRDGAAVEVCTLGTTSQAIPSVVVLREDGEILTGEAAERRAPGEPTRTAREFKRRLGDPVPMIIGTTPYGAESLMALLLHAIVDQVTEREGSAPDVVVLTHPANYSDYKRGLLEESARLAGLDLASVRFLSEPQAAAAAYASQSRVEAGEVVAVYDFGGGTFDAAVVRKDEGEGFSLLGHPEGMDRLGGIDIDQAVLAHVDNALDGMVTSIGASDPAARPSITRLREEVRRAKEGLSTDTDSTIAVSLPGLQTEVRLTREELEGMIRPRVVETVEALRRAVASTGVPMDQVSRVLLVGGSSRIPLVGLLVRELTARPVAVDAHPKLAIATGAAIVGAREAVANVIPSALDTAATSVAGSPVTEAVPASGGSKARVGRRAAAAGAGIAATAGAAAIVGLAGKGSAAGAATAAGTTAGGVAPGAVSAASGPAGSSLAAGPAGTPLTAGPAGTAMPAAAPPTAGGPPPSSGGGGGSPSGSGAGPHASGGAAKVAKTAAQARKLPIAIAAAVGTVAAVAAVAAVVTSQGDSPPSTATTIAAAAPATTEATQPGAPTVPGATSTPATTAPKGGRGLVGATSIVAGLRNDNTGKGVPGVATGASLGAPTTVVSTNGTTYVLDSGVGRVVRISGGQATIAYQGKTTIGGLAATATGKVVLMTTDGLVEITGDGQSTPFATMAELGGRVSPGSQTPLAFDGAGNLYIGNSNHYQVLRRAVDGTMSLVAGNGEFAGTGAPKGDGGAATAAPMGAMSALVVDGKGSLLIGEPLGPIRKVAVDGTLSTIAGAGATKLVAGSGTFAPDGTKAVDVDFAGVNSLAIDAKGRIYVGDSQSSAIVRIVGDGTIEFVAGDQLGVVEAEANPRPANQTRVTDAYGLAFDRSGALLVTSAALLFQIAGVSAS